MKLFIFVSSAPEDKCTQVVCFAHSFERAHKLATMNFRKHNYKGKPIALAV